MEIAALPMTYDHYFWLYGTPSPAGSSCGTWGDEGRPSKPAVYSNYSFDDIVGFSQELGHNFGMTHEPTITCPGNATFLDDPTQCTHVEYGNQLSFMGGGAHHPSAYHKYAQGWIGKCNVVTGAGSGTYTLVPQELPCNGVQLLQVPAPKTRMPPGPGTGSNARQGTAPMLSNYYLEMRGKYGFDANLTSPMVIISIGAGLPTQNAAAPYLYLLDLTPEAGRANLNNAGLMTVGQSYTDPAGGLTFTLMAIDNTSATVSITGGGTTTATCSDMTAFMAPGPGASSCGPLATISGDGGVTGPTDARPPGTGGASGHGRSQRGHGRSRRRNRRCNRRRRQHDGRGRQHRIDGRDRRFQRRRGRRSQGRRRDRRQRRLLVRQRGKDQHGDRSRGAVADLDDARPAPAVAAWTFLIARALAESTRRESARRRFSPSHSIAGLVALAPRAARANGAFPDSQSILVPSSRPNEISLVTNFGVVASHDGGHTWLWSCEQDANSLGYLYQYNAAPQNRLFAVANQNLIFSDDGTCGWSIAKGMITGLGVTDFFPDPNDASHVLAEAFDYTSSTYVVLQSTDSGATFTSKLYTSDPKATMTGIEIARSDPKTIYVTLTAATTNAPMLGHSNDGGATWKLIDLTSVLGTAFAEHHRGRSDQRAVGAAAVQRNHAVTGAEPGRRQDRDGVDDRQRRLLHLGDARAERGNPGRRHRRVDDPGPVPLDGSRRRPSRPPARSRRTSARCRRAATRSTPPRTTSATATRWQCRPTTASPGSR